MPEAHGHVAEVQSTTPICGRGRGAKDIIIRKIGRMLRHYLQNTLSLKTR